MARINADAKQATRKRLLEAGASEFAKHGLEGANVNEISLAAGLAKGTIYNYFPSKEAVFLAVVAEACRLAEQGAEPMPGASTSTRLENVLAADVEWARRHEPFARVLVAEALNPDPDLHPRVIAAAAPFIDRVTAILRDGVERGEVRDDVPTEQLALVFVGLGDLALVQHWGSGGTWPRPEEIPPLITRLFLQGAGR